MIRVTPAQLSLLELNLSRGGEPSRPRPQREARRKGDLPENQLERQIVDFLSWRGYVNLRQHVGLFTPWRIVRQGSLDEASRNVVRVGEVGAADWLSLRPVIAPGGRALDGPHLWQGFFWEAKAPGKRPAAAQLAWIDKRRQCGFEAAWFNQFAARDRPSTAVASRDSHVFETWFTGYFKRYEWPP
jgi:hypothetical protein